MTDRSLVRPEACLNEVSNVTVGSEAVDEGTKRCRNFNCDKSVGAKSIVNEVSFAIYLYEV